MPPRLRSAPPAAALGAIASLLGCFDGADALHLPCERDEDCGRGQSCVAGAGAGSGFCDGPPDSVGGTASSGDETAGSSTTDETSSGSDGSSSGPPIPVCGNGVVEDGESCDEGEDTPTCNSAIGCRGAACCVAPACGDGYVNLAAFETCESGDDCTDGCVELILFDDFASMAGGSIFAGPPGGLEPVPPPPPNSSPEWRFDAGGQWWETGTYADGGGGAVLATTTAVPLPAQTPAGTEVQLRFRHFYSFDDGTQGGCGRVFRGDGGMVFVYVEGGTTMDQIVPLSGGGFLQDESPTPCNPYSQDGNDRPAYVGRSVPTLEDMVPATFSLASWQGASIRLVFVSSYDCGNCWGIGDPPESSGWRIDDLEVGVHPIDSELAR